MGDFYLTQDVYNPHEWAESSFYDELAKAQKADMERREKEKKERTKVEFISGTVKKPSGVIPPNGNSFFYKYYLSIQFGHTFQIDAQC